VGLFAHGAFRVILLPGSVLPGDLAYGSLVVALGSVTDAIVKDLELYAIAEAPPDYSLDLEVAGVLREADARGSDQFHLVGYRVAALRRSRSPRATRSGWQASPCWRRPGQVSGISARLSGRSGASTTGLKRSRKTTS
jgi:hypothetical protein